MSDSRTALEILIRTTAEMQGVNLTEDGLQRVKEKVQELSAKNNENAESSSGVTDAMKEQAQETLRNMAATEKASASAKQAASAAQGFAKELGALRLAGNGVSKIMNGLSQGDLPGLVNAARGVGDVFKAMQTGFATFAGAASAAAVVAAPLLVLIGAMKLAANDAEVAMKRWWDEAAKSAEAYKVKSAEIKVAAAADLAAMLADVAKLAAAYDSLIGRMDAADKRAKEVSAAQKELALAKASTPEERAAIEKQFAENAVANDILNAGVREKNAKEAQTQASQENRNAEAGVRDAELAFKANPSRANRDALAAAKGNLDEVQTRTSEVFKKTDGEIDDARHTRKLGGIKQDTFKARAANTGPGPAASPSGAPLDAGRAAELRRTAESSQASGDFAAQAAAVKELKLMNAAAKEFSKSTAQHASATAKSLDKAAAKIKLASQAGTGGG